jgi:hypothetical protein
VIFSLLPVVDPYLVCLPWVISCMMGGEWTKGIMLFVLQYIVSSVVAKVSEYTSSIITYKPQSHKLFTSKSLSIGVSSMTASSTMCAMLARMTLYCYISYALLCMLLYIGTDHMHCMLCVFDSRVTQSMTACRGS